MRQTADEIARKTDDMSADVLAVRLEAVLKRASRKQISEVFALVFKAFAAVQDKSQAKIDAAHEAREKAEAERDEARRQFNDIDLCKMGQAPCEGLLAAEARADRIRAETIEECAKVMERRKNFVFGLDAADLIRALNGDKT